MSSNGNISRVTGHLYEELTGHRWLPRTKASDAKQTTLAGQTALVLANQSWIQFDIYSNHWKEKPTAVKQICNGL